ncbi:hypothetical protein QFZ75_008032 [Streptomyces sp. V3I8]|uniref:hypothetical protein n=1 Tax=Streptomyces sp. V3I8 TaxID=3042279 RepID=UPI0027847AD6|nr:hypothetical protein [Streptomyces sp. V3I8]MDQ1041530.1 hypothetical protein [Streptomyces sp. V3I8]
MPAFTAPATLETETARLRRLAHRLIGQGADEEDLMDLLQATRDHYARYALDVTARTGTATASPDLHRGVMLAADLARLVVFELNPAPDPAEPREYLFCGATIDPPDGPTYTCNRRVAHRGTPCGPDMDKD